MSRNERAEIEMATAYLKACIAGDEKALVSFNEKPLAQVMAESLDYPGGPHMAELMHLVLQFAYGSDVNLQRTNARNMLTRMALTFARHNADL